MRVSTSIRSIPAAVAGIRVQRIFPLHSTSAWQHLDTSSTLLCPQQPGMRRVKGRTARVHLRCRGAPCLQLQLLHLQLEGLAIGGGGAGGPGLVGSAVIAKKRHAQPRAAYARMGSSTGAESVPCIETRHCFLSQPSQVGTSRARCRMLAMLQGTPSRLRMVGLVVKPAQGEHSKQGVQADISARRSNQRRCHCNHHRVRSAALAAWQLTEKQPRLGPLGPLLHVP